MKSQLKNLQNCCKKKIRKINQKQLSILEFTADNRFLSNFYPCRIKYKGKIFKTSEHLYQWFKFKNKDCKQQILNARTPAETKKLARKFTKQGLCRSDWFDINLKVMWLCLKLKFKNHVLRKKLLDTGTRFLMEGNTWKDTFWGYDFNLKEGNNELGKLLMKLREKLDTRK